jgi:hypothetical protein
MNYQITEATKISLAHLITEGKEIAERENIPASKFFDPELSAASVAVSRYDEAHRDWLEANEDEQRKGRATNEMNIEIKAGQRSPDSVPCLLCPVCSSDSAVTCINIPGPGSYPTGKAGYASRFWRRERRRNVEHNDIRPSL